MSSTDQYCVFNMKLGVTREALPGCGGAQINVTLGGHYGRLVLIFSLWAPKGQSNELMRRPGELIVGRVVTLGGRLGQVRSGLLSWRLLLSCLFPLQCALEIVAILGLYFLAITAAGTFELLS